MPTEQVNDPADPRLSQFRRLNDRAHRRSLEAAGPFGPGITVVEGWFGIERLLGSRFEPTAFLVDVRRMERLASLLDGRRAVVYTATPDVIQEVVGFDLHRGVVATARRSRALHHTNVIRRGRQLVVAEGISDAVNLGSLIRNAAALGADGLLLDSTCCDHLSRRAVRVSMGYALTLPIARADAATLIQTLKGERFTVVGLTPSPDAAVIDAAHGIPDGPLAVAVGSEGTGLSSTFMESCDSRMRIPMAPGIDSLNVATAAAVALSHVFEVRAIPQ